MDSTYRSIPATTTFTLILCSVVYLAYLFGLKNTIVQNPDFKEFTPTVGHTNLWNKNHKFSKVSACQFYWSIVLQWVYLISRKIILAVNWISALADGFCCRCDVLNKWDERVRKSYFFLLCSCNEM